MKKTYVDDKIFVGCLIHPVKEYCFSAWIKSLKKLEGNLNICLVDTGNDAEFTKLAKESSFEVHNVPGTGVFDSISRGRKKLVEFFLASDAEYFFSLECDVFVESDVPQKLLAYDKKIILIPYVLGYIYEPIKRLKEDFLLSVNGEDRLYLTMQELLKLSDGYDPVKINEGGLGCSMIHRDVLEKYYEKMIINEIESDDKAFYKFCRDENLPRFASISLFNSVKHYPHFHLEYAVFNRELRNRYKNLNATKKKIDKMN